MEQESATPAPVPSVTDHWIRDGDKTLYARRWTPPNVTPDRVPIVMLHDSLGCVELWRDFPALLCEWSNRPVVAYDRMGFGRSSALANRPGLDFVAEEATSGFRRVRQALQLDEFIVLGHSVGGAMAIHCAAGDAGDCKGLITIAAQVFTEEITLSGIRAAKLQFADPAQMERLKRYHGEKAGWVVNAWTESWLDSRFATWSVVDVLPRVVCPVFAIHGGMDEYGSTRHPELITTLCSGTAQKLVLPDAGHLPHRENPEQVAKAISRFLR